jgi:hypothetical protein
MIVITLFLTVCFGYISSSHITKHNEQLIRSEVISLKDGYGYQILKGEKILILQEFIPGLPGKQTFRTEKQALSVANLVLSKLEKGQSPILVPSDLSKLKISSLVAN